MQRLRPRTPAKCRLCPSQLNRLLAEMNWMSKWSFEQTPFQTRSEKEQRKNKWPFDSGCVQQRGQVEPYLSMEPCLGCGDESGRQATRGTATSVEKKGQHGTI